MRWESMRSVFGIIFGVSVYWFLHCLCRFETIDTPSFRGRTAFLAMSFAPSWFRIPNEIQLFQSYFLLVTSAIPWLLLYAIVDSR